MRVGGKTYRDEGAGQDQAYIERVAAVVEYGATISS